MFRSFSVKIVLFLAVFMFAASVVSSVHAEEIDTTVAVEDGQKKVVIPCEKEQKALDAAQKSVEAAQSAVDTLQKEYDALDKAVEEALANLSKGDPTKFDERLKQLEMLRSELTKKGDALFAARLTLLQASAERDAADDALADCLEKSKKPKGPIVLDSSVDNVIPSDVVTY